MKSVIATVLLVVLGQAAQAQTPGEPSKRLAAFSSAQTACKIMVVTNQGAARSFVLATERPLSTVCECTALLTVANMSDDQVSNLLGGDKHTAHESLKPLAENLSRCIKLGS